MTKSCLQMVLFISGLALLLSGSKCGRHPIPFDDGSSDPLQKDSEANWDSNSTLDTDTQLPLDSDNELPIGTIYAFKGTPFVNGSVSDDFVWSMIHPLERVINGIGNNTVYFNVLWDHNFLYVGATVKDDRVMSDSADPWHDDCIEVFVDGNNSKSSKYDKHDFQYMAAATNHPLRVTNTRPNNAQWGTSIIQGNGYSVEIGIPWTDLGIVPEAGMSVGFDLGVHDDDDGNDRDSHLMWRGNDDNWKDTRNYGTVILSELPSTAL